MTLQKFRRQWQGDEKRVIRVITVGCDDALTECDVVHSCELCKIFPEGIYSRYPLFDAHWYYYQTILLLLYSLWHFNKDCRYRELYEMWLIWGRNKNDFVPCLVCMCVFVIFYQVFFLFNCTQLFSRRCCVRNMDTP